jgi:thiol:disulfide interchange protein
MAFNIDGDPTLKSWFPSSSRVISWVSCIVLLAVLTPIPELSAQDGAGGGLLDQLESEGLGGSEFGESGFGDSPFGESDPVQLTVKGVAAVLPGARAEILIQAKMDRGWHIYGIDMDRELGIPTAIIVSEMADLEMFDDVIEPEPHERDAEEGVYLEHEGEITFKLPLGVPDDAELGPRKVILEVTYQACDATQCLNPVTRVIEVAVEVGSVKGSDSAVNLNIEAQAPDSPVVWKSKGLSGIQPGEPFTVEVVAEIERGWHIYGLEMDEESGFPTRFSLAGESNFVLSTIKELTPAHDRFDPLIQSTSIEHEKEARFQLTMVFEGEELPDETTIPLIVESMSCDVQMCLPQERLELNLPVVRNASNEITTGTSSETRESKNLHQVSYKDENLQLSARFDRAEVSSGEIVELTIEGQLLEDLRIPAFRKDVQGEAEEEGLLGIVLLAISGALLALVTPCVYPMIPITISVFTKQAHESRSRVLGLAALFGGGIVVSFTSLGFILSAILGEEGANFMATNGYVNLTIGVLFVVFGFSLFGYYDIQLPAFIRNRVGGGGGGGGAASVLVMGLVFAVTTFTCVGPIVAALLALAAGGGPGFAAVGMLAFSSTIALPFVVLALFPKVMTGLPRSGGWLSTVKVVLGFIELLAAWKFFSAVATYWQFGEVVNREVIMGIWGLTLAALVLNLVGKLKFPHDSPVKSISLGRGSLIAVTFLGAACCFYAMTGWRLNENIEAQLLVPSLHANSSLPWKHLDRNNPLDFEAEMETLKSEVASGVRERKPVFLNFTGHT